MRRRLKLVAGGLVAAAIGFLLGAAFTSSEPAPAGGQVPAAASGTGSPPAAVGNDQVVFAVDPSLVPDIAEVEGLEEGDPPRPVGRLEAPDGTVSDVVLSELVVTSTDRDRVEDLARRYDGEIVDELPGDDGEPTDYLVRITPPPPDLEKLAGDLVALEPDHEGRFTATNTELLGLLAVAAAETDEDDFLIGLNWVDPPTGIAEAFTREAPKDGVPRDAFTWPYIASGTNQDIGVDVAWRLLAGYARLASRVKILVVDGGFNFNPDLPPESEILRGEWGKENPGTCTGGAPCPWHGTDVAIAAAGQLDNEYGAAGSAGPVAELYVFDRPAGRWATFRKVKRAVKENDIDVVNMSFGGKVTVFRKAAERRAERLIGKMVKEGAIVFAAAGNDGEDVDRIRCKNGNCREAFVMLPCETEAAICVGGMGWNTTTKAEGSNYGSKTDGRSVDIYGPYCVYSIKDPADPIATNDVRRVCGTSFASPFVAGVAALVKAANPSLGPKEIWEILRDTAYEGGLELDQPIEGHQRRINAAAAVAKALGVEMSPPEVVINQPADGKKYSQDEFPEFSATATEFTNFALPILWESDIDGPLNNAPSFDTVRAADLTPGVHTITATAVDMLGQVGTAQITIEVVNEPPEVSIAWPQPGTKIYEGPPPQFIGQTNDPDTFGPLPDSDVFWVISRKSSNEIVAARIGHTAMMLESLPPGSYTVEFSAEDGSITVIAVSDLTVLAVPPGESVPLLGIQEPKGGQSLGSYNGDPVTIEFAGSAFDEQDGELSGTRFRWTATSDRGTEKVLCQGSAFPDDPYPDDGSIDDLASPGDIQGPVLTLPKNCSSFTAELDLDGANSVTWAIRLEAVDSAGLVGSISIPIEIRFVTP